MIMRLMSGATNVCTIKSLEIGVYSYIPFPFYRMYGYALRARNFATRIIHTYSLPLYQLYFMFLSPKISDHAIASSKIQRSFADT